MKFNINWKSVSMYSILIIVCITSFLIAKYIVRDHINWENPPVDVSEKL